MVEPPAARAGPPLVVGWKEYVALPELGISSLKAKIDTGARTSSLHVTAIRRLAGRDDGEAELEITIAPDRRRPERLVRARVHQLARIRVTDSGGHSELRPVIETLLVVGPVTKRVRVTLADRSSMLFRMILGRKAIEG
ncbi:MAG TPA: RimK/LysX family protein, partial [Thermoanaerobaculia bacterium]|nr:RimK/LysX family protein [Thermoanaerobaculia bacterium]